MTTPKPTPETYRQLFEDDKRGAAILEELAVLFGKPAVLTGGIDAVIATYHRMGAQSVVQHILNQINRANGVPQGEDDAPQEVQVVQ